ncbi:MAG: Trk system potassium transporter TrkA [Candidatus Spyradocola sp.]|nr:Trk system potassium transporter TrkA [Candidatus Spyradocola sp.]
MRILVVGDGKVGHTIAEQLIREKHDVVIIDQDDEVLTKCEDTLDVICVRGNGANAKVLLDAQADRADILIATTANDETNMLCGLIAKRLGTKYIIARIRDPEYNDSLTLLQRELGIDMALNPERATALEIGRLLRFPFASNIESFAKGRVEMVEFRAQEHDVVVGHALKDLARMRGLPQVLYAVIEREGRVIIPTGDFIIQAGDRVHVAGDMVTITAYFQYLGKNSLRIRRVMLLGGGRISYYLAKMLVPMGIRVSMIEINERKANHLSELLPEVNVIYGDGTDQELLDQEGLKDMDAFVTLSDRDEENLMTGLFAVRQGVPKVIVKNNRVAYADLINSLGLDSVVSPRSITCANILRYVRGRVNSEGTKVERLYRLMDGKAEALEFIARAGDPYIGIPLKDLRTRPGVLVAVIVRKGQVIVPFGNDHIEAGNSVVILSRDSGIKDLNEVIRR